MCVCVNYGLICFKSDAEISSFCVHCCMQFMFVSCSLSVYINIYDKCTIYACGAVSNLLEGSLHIVLPLRSVEHMRSCSGGA